MASSSERAKVFPRRRRRRCGCRLSSDIIMWEILPCLPVKTLCRFRCVSKSWYHLLSSDPEFLQLHRRRSEQKSPTLLVITPDYDANRIPFFTMKMDEHDGKRRVAGSAADLGFNTRRTNLGKRGVSACRGLVLVYNRYTIRVWNPATGEWIDIDVPPPILTDDGEDSLPKGIVAAIGYVESTGEYKLLISFHKRNKTPCQVLTVGGSGGWRATKNPPPFSLSLSKYGPCKIPVVNGFIHMLPKCSSNCIARFDLEKEEWSVLDIDPRHLSPRYEYGYHLLLMEVGGLLCLVQFAFGHWYRADILLLKDYDKGIWVNEYTIDIPYDSYYILRWRERWVEPLMIEEDGRIMFTNDKLIFYYDPKSISSFQEIYKVKSYKTNIWPTLYAETTLASLKRGKIGRTGRCPAV